MADACAPFPGVVKEGAASCSCRIGSHALDGLCRHLIGGVIIRAIRRHAEGSPNPCPLCRSALHAPWAGRGGRVADDDDYDAWWRVRF